MDFPSLFDTAFTRFDFLYMLKGAGTTPITFWAVLGGTLAGLLLGLARASAPGWVNTPIGAVLDVFRSVPLLIQFVMANSLKSVIGLNWGSLHHRLCHARGSTRQPIAPRSFEPGCSPCRRPPAVLRDRLA